MTTVEKLLVQIFERKNSIIEQVKQQTELYSQHLASKLLIDGVTLPSWLWNPNTTSDANDTALVAEELHIIVYCYYVIAELNKEELISKLLRPYPQPSVRCSVAHYPVYDNLVVTGDNEGFSDGAFMENMAFSKGLNRQNHPTVSPLSSEDRAGCALNSVPEPDASVTSPEDPTDERIVNIYNAPDQSLAGIQRSKSRQKALELRHSAKALAKSGVSNENIRDVFSSQIRFSLSATNQAGQNDELPKLAEPCVVGSQSGADWDLDNADSRTKEKGTDAYSGRITRSRSYTKVPVFVRGSLTLGCSSEDCKDNPSIHIAEVRRRESMPISDSEHAGNYVNMLTKSAGPSTVYCQSCGDMKADGADSLSKDTGTNVNAGRITRSNISNKSQHCGRDSSKAETSSDDYQRIDIVMMDSRDDVPPEYVCESLLNPKNVLNEECDARESISGDCQSRRKRVTDQSLSSSKQNACVDEVSDLEIRSHSAKADIVMMDSRDDVPPEYVCESLLNPKNVVNEGCDVRESISGDFQSHRERGTDQSLSSSKQTACVGEVSDLEVRSQSAKADHGFLAPLSGKSAQEVNDSNEVHGLVKPSVGLFRRVTRSQTRSNDKELYEPVAYNENPSFGGTMSISDLKKKSAANDEIQNTLSGQFGPPCYGTHDMRDEHKNASFFMVNEFVLHDHVDKSGNNSFSDAKQRRGLESEVAPSPSGSIVFVEPKQLIFNEFEERNLKAFTSSSGKRGLDNLPEKTSCSLSDPAVSLDKGTSVGVNQLSLDKQSPGTSVISSKGEAVQKDSFESDIQENPNNQAEKFVPVINGTSLKNSGNEIEAWLNFNVSEVHCEADNTPSKMVDIPDVCIHPTKLHVERGLESLPEGHMEEGDWSGEGKDKSQLVSSAPESENLRPLNSCNLAKEPREELCDSLIGNVDMLNQICGVLDKMKQFPAQQSEILSCLEGEVCSQHGDSPLRDYGSVTYGTVWSHGENSSLERRFRHASMDSWPQLKRRKIENQQSHSFTTSPSFRVRKPHSIQRAPASTYLKNMETNVDTVMDTFHVNKSTDIEPSEMNSNLAEGIESTFLSQNGEVGLFNKEKNEHKNSSSIINDEQLGADFVLCLNKKESRNSQGCCTQGISTASSSGNHFDASELGYGQHSQHLCNLEKNTENLTSENLTLSNTMIEGTQSPKWESGLQTQHSVLSPTTEDLEPIDVDQSMPVLEGFIVDAEADSVELDFASDGIDFDKLNLPWTTIERASILVEICRSTSMDKPSSHFSSAFEFQGTQKLFQSVPNGHLEHLDLASSLPLNSDVGKQLQSGSSSADDYKEALEGLPYSDCLPYSGARYGWNSRNQYASPVGKLWERLSSHTGSSEKSLSSNPELTCFPIEEDPSISEENKTLDENVDDVQEEIDSSLANHCDKRHPLKDLTNLGLSVSAHKETSRADSVDIVKTKLSVTGTQDEVQSSPKNQYRNKRETRGKQTSYIGATDGRKNQTSLHGTNGFKKAKESINNNISKSSLSVKTSLKRQDQKLSLKDSRRNNIISNVSSFIPLIQQKQAATACTGKRDVKVKALEAAEAAKRVEEKRENERKMRKEALKLERAKLEEENLRNMELEKKKKEVERKKKDADIIAKKRMREEDEKKEKEKKRMRLEAKHRQREQEEKMRAGKAEKERSKDEQMKTKKEFLNESKKQQSREIIRGDDAGLKKADTTLTTTEVVMSYEECGTSDQSCGKHAQAKQSTIKSTVALLLPLQQEMDPDTVFPPESFCSMDEVLLPRKLQQKQVAA
ncbi:hypothetical protein DH2020_016938 [Rehmannia glutinosa]|uniref:Inner centromere protein ARK-binding domain-containing protein n=1 Tax=Rehmannia glutinosa TaxID=99300 RepID=A0ABR0WPD2_REHGL